MQALSHVFGFVKLSIVEPLPITPLNHDTVRSRLGMPHPAQGKLSGPQQQPIPSEKAPTVASGPASPIGPADTVDSLGIYAPDGTFDTVPIVATTSPDAEPAPAVVPVILSTLVELSVSPVSRPVTANSVTEAAWVVAEIA